MHLLTHLKSFDTFTVSVLSLSYVFEWCYNAIFQKVGNIQVLSGLERAFVGKVKCYVKSRASGLLCKRTHWRIYIVYTLQFTLAVYKIILYFEKILGNKIKYDKNR